MSALGLAFKGANLYFGAQSLGLSMDPAEVVRWGGRLLKVADHLGPAARAVDERALAEMVELAQQRAPQRTGLLHTGVTGTREGDAMVFQASAQRDESSADYARFVEHGTRGGTRGRVVADATFFERSNGTRRKSRRTHPGTEAQPFFYNSAREVLERRRLAQEEVMARATAEDA